MSLSIEQTVKQFQQYHSIYVLCNDDVQKKLKLLKIKQKEPVETNKTKHDYIGNYMMYINEQAKLKYDGQFQINRFDNYENINRELSLKASELTTAWHELKFETDLTKTADTWKLDASDWVSKYYPDTCMDIGLDFNFLTLKSYDVNDNKNVKLANQKFNGTVNIKNHIKRKNNALLMSKYNTYHTLQYINNKSVNNDIMNTYIKEWEQLRNNWSKFVNIMLTSKYIDKFDTQFTTHYGNISYTFKLYDNRKLNIMITKTLEYVPECLINTKKIKLQLMNMVHDELNTRIDNLKTQYEELEAKKKNKKII